MKSIKAMIIILTIFAMVSSVSAVVITADADGHANGADISNAFAGMTLSAFGTHEGIDGKVYARVPINPSFASTGKLVFGSSTPGSDVVGSPHTEIWKAGSQSYMFRADFHSAADYVCIDAIGNNSSDYAFIEAYDSVGNLLDTATSPQLTSGNSYSLQINRPSFDIAYVIAAGLSGDTVYLDNLSANVPEPATMVLLGLGTLVAARRRSRHQPC